MEEIDAFTFSDCEETSAVVSGGTPSCPPSSSCGLSVLDTFPVLDATVSDKPREELEPSVVHSGLRWRGYHKFPRAFNESTTRKAKRPQERLDSSCKGLRAVAGAACDTSRCGTGRAAISP